MSKIKGKHWGMDIADLVLEDMTLDDVFQAFKARLIEELLVNTHGTSHYGKLEDHSDTTKGPDGE